MKQHESLDLHSLKRLKAVSFEMLAFAETSDWNAVLNCDNTRLEILKNSSLQRDNGTQKEMGNTADSATVKARSSLIKTILDLDKKIQEIAGKERKAVIDKQMRQKAQIAAQSSYQQTLSTGIG
ncbi:MAG: hypothetical protein KTR35_20370 [Gammaproteobacteria bacterium]|nr:hypothetical protein [Gammaproteobacteria bacterium]